MMISEVEKIILQNQLTTLRIQRRTLDKKTEIYREACDRMRDTRNALGLPMPKTTRRFLK